ncbi:hypothetical protein [Lysinibacillus sp. Bpr_S20]|uniref:hypothetical protein n=1 Tax=Lysinibacillus sp. Bpr_S20 TaxID=2933964 RepID=UPI002012965A|nr:hypothetical protein [Lysinibacillus sp. Bpr_S20]MCL1699140.1 hypothetical protein [Lysinibacillus sp. Bpr_S20]
MKRNFLYFFMITIVLSVIFSGVKPQETKAATILNLDPENLTKEETTSGSDQRLDTFLNKMFSVNDMFNNKELIKHFPLNRDSHIKKLEKNIFKLSEAKKIVDGLMKMQDKIRLGEAFYYTKAEIYEILSPGFTPKYIDKYIKEDMMLTQDNKYIFKGTDDIRLNPNTIFMDSWAENQYVKKPTVTYSTKDGKEYLLISQYRKPFKSMLSSHNGFYDDLYLIKENSKSNWKAYDFKHPTTK